jgi:hypothetical protein
MDFLAIDTLYSALAFSHRHALHSAAVEYLTLKTHSAVNNFANLFPHIIHHMMMAQQEDRAAARMTTMHIIGGGPTFIQDLVIGEFTKYIPVVDTEETHLSLYIRAMKALPAIPFLRGLAKGLQQQRVGDKVLRCVKTLQDRYRARKQAAHKQRLLIPGQQEVSITSTMSGESSSTAGRRSSKSNMIHQASHGSDTTTVELPTAAENRQEVCCEVSQTTAPAQASGDPVKVCLSALYEHDTATHYLLKLNTLAMQDRAMLSDLSWWRRCLFRLEPSQQGAVLSYASDNVPVKQITCMCLLPGKFIVYAPRDAVQMKSLAESQVGQIVEQWQQYEAAVHPGVQLSQKSSFSPPAEVFIIAIHQLPISGKARPLVLAATSDSQRTVWMATLRSCQPEEIRTELPF